MFFIFPVPFFVMLIFILMYRRRKPDKPPNKDYSYQPYRVERGTLPHGPEYLIPGMVDDLAQANTYDELISVLSTYLRRAYDLGKSD